jgi:hypothetical protein
MGIRSDIASSRAATTAGPDGVALRTSFVRVFRLVTCKDPLSNTSPTARHWKAEKHCAVQGGAAALHSRCASWEYSIAQAPSLAQKCGPHKNASHIRTIAAQLIERTAAHSHEGWNLLTTWSPDPDWTGDRPDAPVCTSKNLTPAPLSAVTEDKRAG